MRDVQRWLSHAFWYSIIAAFLISVAVSLLGLVANIAVSLFTIAVNAPAALRNRLRR